MKSNYHIVIVGAGLGGLSAAYILSGHNLNVLMIDENMKSGGQLLRKPNSAFHSASRFDPDQIKPIGFNLIQKVNNIKTVDCLFDAQVIGVFEQSRLLIQLKGDSETGINQQKGIVEVKAETIIFATGARERYLPFKGWTLPGVMSLGAAQILMKSQGILPARSNLIAGSSPLMMVLASELMSNRGKVVSLIDENNWIKKLKCLPLVRHHWPKLLEGGFYSLQMLLKKIPIYQGYRLIEAFGKKAIEYALIMKTTPDGNLVPGTEKRVFAQSLLTGYGFVPNIELPLQAGCDIEFQHNQGGWIVKVDPQCETSVKNMFAVGELNGIAGSKKSFLQGKIAAMIILKRFGKIGGGRNRINFENQLNHLLVQSGMQKEYAVFLNNLCRVPNNAFATIPDDTIICRCEDITMGTIKKWLEQDFNTLGSLKKATRCGMGRCQGRICTPVILDIVSALTQKKHTDIGFSYPRAPVKNTEIRAFLD